MKLWRCQYGDVNGPEDFRIDNSGVCGPGIYAMKEGARSLRRYYSIIGNTKLNTFSFDVPDHLVKEIKGLGLTSFQAIKERIQMEMEKGYRVFVCKHGGINVPKGKQVVITDYSIISNIKKL